MGQERPNPALGCRRHSSAEARSFGSAAAPAAAAPSMDELHALFMRLADTTRAYDFSQDNNVLRSAAAAHREDVDASPIPEVEGRVHSIESMSAIDGPGLRWVMFTQGCGYRCQFCSNPDSWEMGGGTATTSKDIARQIARALPYLRYGEGGVTVSGGEPLLQPDFVSAVFQECRRMGVPTAVDTTGTGSSSAWRKVLPHTDLAMLCVKAPRAETYARLTGGFNQSRMLKFAAVCEHMSIPVWVRYVLIPGLTDSTYDLDWLQQFCEDHSHSVVQVDILPYHEFGVHKWEVMGLEYPLAGQQRPSREQTLDFLGALRQRVSRLGLSVIATGVE